MTDLLSEPESVAERRKELNNLIKVMRSAQKIIRRDPDLMTVMEINIEDSDITAHNAPTSQSKPKKEEPKIDLSKSVAPPKSSAKAEPPKLALGKNTSSGGKKGGYGNLFG